MARSTQFSLYSSPLSSFWDSSLAGFPKDSELVLAPFVLSRIVKDLIRGD
jgi:hypothetical protein